MICRRDADNHLLAPIEENDSLDDVRRLIEMAEEVADLVHVADKNTIAEAEHKHFEELARQAAGVAAEQYFRLKEPMPPLVLSALRAGLSQYSEPSKGTLEVKSPTHIRDCRN